MKHPIAITLAAAVVLGTTPDASPAAPTITNVDIRGLQTGATTTITVSGKDLLPDPKLLLSVPIAKQSVREGATATRVEIEVTLDAAVTPGIANLWLSTEQGVSNSTLVAVDALPQVLFAEQIATLPAALHGSLGGSQRLKTKFTGTANQNVTIEVESNRLGGKLRPVLHLLGADGRQIDWALPSPTLGGDTRLTATLLAAGEYTIELHDAEYAGPSPGHLRLKVGDFYAADLVFPPAVARDKTASLELIGIRQQAQQISLPAAVGDIGRVPLPWPSSTNATGPRPSVLVSQLPEFVEDGATNQDVGAPPLAVSGRIDVAGQHDRFLVSVRPGAKLRFEVIAAAFGSPLDAQLEIQKEDGTVLARNDDGPDSTDSVLDYTVPADLETLAIAVNDANGRGGPRFIYRACVTPLDADAPAEQDFELVAIADRENVPQGGADVVEVFVNRLGYEGPIKVSVDNLPSGVQVAGGDIAAGATGTLLTLSGSGNGVADVISKIRGTATIDGRSVTRIAMIEKHAAGDYQTWLAGELAVALASPPDVPLKLNWGEVAADSKLVLGGKLPLPLQFDWPVGDFGAVRFALVTSQNIPKNNGNPDMNKAIRPEKAVEVALDGKAQQAIAALAAADKSLDDAKKNAEAVKAAAEKMDDAEAKTKAIDDAAAKVKEAGDARAAADTAAKEAFAAAPHTAEMTLLIPATVPPVAYELALRAELLNKAKNEVLTTTYTSVRRFETLNPIGLKLATPANIEAQLDAKDGATIKLAGAVERLAGLTGDVTVTLEALPAGSAAPKAVVAADKTDYELELKIPANFKPDEYTGIKLFATGKMEPNARETIRSESIELKLVVKPAETQE